MSARIKTACLRHSFVLNFIIEPPCACNKTLCFSFFFPLVNLPHLNLIPKPARRTLELGEVGEEIFFFPTQCEMGIKLKKHAPRVHEKEIQERKLKADYWWMLATLKTADLL